MNEGGIGEVIKQIMKEQKRSQLWVAGVLGFKRPQNVSTKLDNGNLTFDSAIEILTVLGYEVTVQPKRPGARPAGQYVIKRSDKVRKPRKAKEG